MSCFDTSGCFNCATGETNVPACPVEAENCKVLNSDFTKCDVCEEGFFKNSLLLCEPCENVSSGCTKCSDFATCEECSTGVLQDGLCVTPAANCEDFNDDDIQLCDSCSERFGFNSMNKCVSCSLIHFACFDCEDLTACTKCSKGIPQFDGKSCVTRAKNCDKLLPTNH